MEGYIAANFLEQLSSLQRRGDVVDCHLRVNRLRKCKSDEHQVQADFRQGPHQRCPAQAQSPYHVSTLLKLLLKLRLHDDKRPSTELWVDALQVPATLPAARYRWPGISGEVLRR